MGKILLLPLQKRGEVSFVLHPQFALGSRETLMCCLKGEDTRHIRRSWQRELSPCRTCWILSATPSITLPRAQSPSIRLGWWLLER